MTPSSLPPLSPRVAIIVLNYRGKDCLVRSLSSLEALNYPQAAKDVIVVDNASCDGSLEEARRLFPHFFFLENPENLGFAKGMNVGIRSALKRGADYVWLFNNDAQAEEESLHLLVNVAERYPEAGLLSPLIVEENNKCIWFAAGRICFSRMRTEHIPAAKGKLANECYESAYLTGCALLLKKEVAQKIGLLDEHFFLYYEDADYSLRARVAGFRLLVVPQARVRHEEQSNFSRNKLYFLVFSGLLFFGKHARPWQRPYLAFYVTIRRIKNVLDRLFRRPRSAMVHQAYKDYFHDHTPLLLPRLR